MKLTKLPYLLCALGTMPLLAAPVTILNNSFENATLTNNDGNGAYNNLVPGSIVSFTGGALSNWNVNASSVLAAGGAFAPTSGGNNWTTTWWGGNNVGYLQLSQGTATLSQDLSATLANNTVYTLSALIGRRTFTPSFNYSIELWAGPTLTGATMLGSASNLTLASNTSGLDSLVYASGAANALAGQSLHVVLRASNNIGTFTEAFFDNVTLDAASGTPEPATYLAAGLGLIAIAWRRRSAA